MTIRESGQRFLEDEDESVSIQSLERIARALGGFLEYLERTGVTDAAALSIEDVRAYLLVDFPGTRPTSQARSDVWFVTKRFLKWLGLRKQSKIYGEFKLCADELRQGFLNACSESR
jgi:hypothetical protein